jgi:hypothetical protein
MTLFPKKEIINQEELHYECEWPCLPEKQGGTPKTFLVPLLAIEVVPVEIDSKETSGNGTSAIRLISAEGGPSEWEFFSGTFDELLTKIDTMIQFHPLKLQRANKELQDE